MRLCMLYMNISVPLGKMMCGVVGCLPFLKMFQLFPLKLEGGGNKRVTAWIWINTRQHPTRILR